MVTRSYSCNGLFHLMSIPLSTNEQPVINLCKTPEQQTILVLTSGQYTYKNVLKSMYQYYSSLVPNSFPLSPHRRMNPLDN